MAQVPEQDAIIRGRRLDQTRPRRFSFGGFLSVTGRRQRRHSASEIDRGFPGKSVQIDQVLPPNIFRNRCKALMRGYGYNIIDPHIAFGGFGVVHRCNYQRIPYIATRFEQGKIFSCKIIDFYPSHRDLSNEVLNALADEIRALIIVDHNNLMKAIEVYNFYDQDPNHNFPKLSFVVMEFADGDLIDLINLFHRIHEIDGQKIINQVAHGVQYLHRNRIAHLDIKLDNVFFFRNNAGGYHFKLGDYGFVHFARKRVGEIIEERSILTDPRGTFDYASPQVIDTLLAQQQQEVADAISAYDAFSADIFYLGTTIINLLSHLPDDFIVAEIEQFRNDPMSNPKWVEDLLPHQTSVVLPHLLYQMLTFHESNRIDIDQVVQHSWLISIPYESGFMQMNYLH